MKLQTGSYYHLYNRSNNQELVFRTQDNYLYFLKNFRKRFDGLLTVFAYCLMPTHFHFLIRVDTHKINELRQKIGIQLSSYTKALNKVFQRNGSLFQQHTKAKHIDDRSYLLTILTYIHQNPIRAGLVKELQAWPYSSYPDLADLRNGTLVDPLIINQYFNSVEDFRIFSKQTIHTIEKKYF